MSFVRNLFRKSVRGFKGLLTDNKITLKNLFVSAVVPCLELLLSAEVFDCPLEHHKSYGLMFLLAPVTIIFIANVLLVSKVGNLTDRICVTRYYRRCHSWLIIPNIIRAMVGPAVWLVSSFADAKYYTCAAVGPSIEKRNLTNVTAIRELEAEFAKAKSMSHIWAWTVFLVMVTVTAFIMTSKKCCLKDDVLLADDYALERREAISAMIMFSHFMEHPDEIALFLKEDEGCVPPGSTAYSSVGNNDDASPPEDANAAEGSEGNKDDKNDIRKSRYVGGDEEIEIHINGIPERNGRKWVLELFKDWSEDNPSWSYDQAYSKFARRYPRITGGRPKEEWVAMGDGNDKVCSKISGRYKKGKKEEAHATFEEEIPSDKYALAMSPVTSLLAKE